jgi:hypothetical protein
LPNGSTEVLQFGENQPLTLSQINGFQQKLPSSGLNEGVGFGGGYIDFYPVLADLTPFHWEEGFSIHMVTTTGRIVLPPIIGTIDVSPNPFNLGG